MDHVPYRLFAHKSRWLTAAGAATLALGISIFLAISPGDGDLQVSAMWPPRLSQSIAGDLRVSVSRYARSWELEPLAGAQVTLFQVDRGSHTYDAMAARVARGRVLRALAAGRTDAGGQVTLALPAVHAQAPAAQAPAAQAPAGGATGQAGPGALVLDQDGNADLVLRITHGREEMWLARSYQRPPAAALALTTDRPLYQPGQTVRMRVLAVDPDTGVPVSGPVRWEIRDPRSNLVLQQDTPASAGGVAHVDFALSPDCIQGTYTLHARLGNAAVSRGVEVRPFRLPRFEVAVVPAQTSITPGSTLAGHVQATYVYGEPVAGAAAELRIQHTRGGARADHTIAGTTDARGRLPFSWPLPPDIDRAPLQLTAVVTSAAGRAERGQATVALASRDLRVELLAAGTGDRWVADQPNHGFLIVSDQTGAPVAGAQVELVLPEQQEERHLALTTDPAGRATFSFRPTYAANQARVRVTAPDGRSLVQRLHLDTWGMSLVIEVDAPRARVGEPLGFTLRHMPSDVTLMAVNRRYPVGGLRVPRGPDHSARATITLDARARGLTVLAAYDARGSFLTSLPLWVVQRGGDQVTMQLDQDVYAPGAEATLTLGFPAAVDLDRDAGARDAGDRGAGDRGAGATAAGAAVDPAAAGSTTPAAAGSAGPAAPVTFGLVGVDEALYALAERVEQPLNVLLRHDPDLVEAAATALGAASLDLAHEDDVDRRIRVARFVRDMRGHIGTQALDTHGSDNLTREVRRHRRQPYRAAWALVLGAAFLVLGYAGGRATWRPLARGDLSGKRVLALIGIVLAAATASALLGLASGEALAGALLVWTAVVTCWLIATAVRQPRLPLSVWLWTVLGLGLLALALALTLSDARDLARWQTWALAISVGAPAVLLLVEIGLWALVLLARRLYQASFGLVTFLGVVLIGLLAPLMYIGGRAYEPERMAGSADFAMPAPMVAKQRAASIMEDEAMAEVAGKADDARPGQAAAGDGPRVRSFFPETMVWLPELAAGAGGTAVARFPVPDSITTWRLDAWAHTRDGRLGQGQAPMRVWQPFFVELDLPTHLTQGDTIDVPVALVNSGTAPVRARVRVTAGGGLGVIGRVPESVDIGPGARALLAVPVRADQPGAGWLEVSAALPGGLADRAGDAVRRPVAIAPHGRTLALTRSGIVGQGWRAAVHIPAEALPATTAARASIYPSVIADALDGLDSMLRRPLGCFEQASSATYPNVLVFQALASTPADRWPGGTRAWHEAHLHAQALLSLGYQKMLSYQNGDGGFALYPGGSSDILLTAYGLMQLAAMSEVLPVDADVLRRAAGFLVAHQNQSGSWPVYAQRVGGGSGHGSDPGQVRATAFAAWALAAVPVAGDYRHTIDRALAHVTANLDAVDAPDTLALAANALLAALRAGDPARRAGDPARRAGEATRALDRLVRLARRDGDVAYWPATQHTWMGGRGVYADIETTALATHALLEAQAHPELLGPALRYLAARRASHGGWGTTQATVWTLRTMHALRARDDGPVALTLRMDGHPLRRDHAEPGADPGHLRLAPGDLLMHTFRPEAVTAGERAFAVDTSGATTAMVQVTASFAVPWDSPRARVAGEPFALALTPAATTLRRGDALWITAELTNPLADAHGATIVELPVPPAAYVDPEPLQALEHSGVIDRFEVLPTHVRLYLAGVGGEETRRFRYLVRPLVRGRVRLPPARAYPFYAPEPMTEREGGSLRVD